MICAGMGCPTGTPAAGGMAVEVEGPEVEVEMGGTEVEVEAGTEVEVEAVVPESPLLVVF